MAKEFLHLAIHFENGDSTAEQRREIEAILNKAIDWFRYAPNCWIIYTGRDAKIWHSRLKEIPWMTQQSYFICGLNMDNRAGWLRKSVWEWMNKPRETTV